MSDAIKLQEMVDSFTDKISDLNDAIFSIDSQITDYTEQLSAVEWAQTQVPVGVHYDLMEYHKTKVVGAGGSFGINDMSTKLSETKALLIADRLKYLDLKRMYQAVLNGDSLPDITNAPDEDPDSPCNSTTAEFNLCNRGSLPTGPNSISDITTIGGKLVICVEAGEPGTWVVVGLQDLVDQYDTRSGEDKVHPIASELP